MTDRRDTERAIAAVALSVAVVLLAACWVIEPRAAMSTARTAGMLLLAVCLSVAILLANKFPIYIRHNTKICVSSIPLYLLIVLLPPPLAATVTGLAVFGGEMVVRSERGSQMSHVVTHAGRWMVLALAGAIVTHSVSPDRAPVLFAFFLLVAAVVLFAGDVLTIPLTVSCITGEPPHRIILACLRGGWAAEGTQYLLGFLGATVAVQSMWALTLLVVPMTLVYLFHRKEVDPETLELLESMADAVDLRNPYTVGHSQRVAELAGLMLDTLGMHGQEATFILVAARLHDIGKTQIPDHVLLKSEAFTPAETIVVESHAELGASLLQRYPDLVRATDMVRHHHERWDGGGYPDGVSGPAIPFGARVIAVAEAFDSLVSDRSSRHALSIEQALQVLLDGAGRQWDPSLVQVLLHSLADRMHPSAVLILETVPRAAQTHAALWSA